MPQIPLSRVHRSSCNAAICSGVPQATICPPPEPQGKPPCQKNPPCSHQRRQERPAPPPPTRRKPPQQPPQDSFLGIGNFLHQLLPKDFCMEDLMVVLLLLLMSGNGEEDQNFALLTLGLYLFL